MASLFITFRLKNKRKILEVNWGFSSDGAIKARATMSNGYLRGEIFMRPRRERWKDNRQIF